MPFIYSQAHRVATAGLLHCRSPDKDNTAHLINTANVLGHSARSTACLRAPVPRELTSEGGVKCLFEADVDIVLSVCSGHGSRCSQLADSQSRWRVNSAGKHSQTWLRKRHGTLNTAEPAQIGFSSSEPRLKRVLRGACCVSGGGGCTEGGGDLNVNKNRDGAGQEPSRTTRVCSIRANQIQLPLECTGRHYRTGLSCSPEGQLTGGSNSAEDNYFKWERGMSAAGSNSPPHEKDYYSGLLKRSLLCHTNGVCHVENALQKNQLSLTMMMMIVKRLRKKTPPVARIKSGSLASSSRRLSDCAIPIDVPLPLVTEIVEREVFRAKSNAEGSKSKPVDQKSKLCESQSQSSTSESPNRLRVYIQFLVEAYGETATRLSRDFHVHKKPFQVSEFAFDGENKSPHDIGVRATRPFR